MRASECRYTVAYGVIGLFTLAFCWKFVPETKGKRLEDIQDFFQAKVDHRKAQA